MAEEQNTLPVVEPPYPFRDKVLSVRNFQNVAYELFAGSTAARQDIFARVAAHHKTNGGAEMDVKSVAVRGDHALRAIIREHNAENVAGSGQYTFVARPNTTYLTPPEPRPPAGRQIKATDDLREALATLQNFRCGAVRDKYTWGCRNEFGYARRNLLPLRYADVDHVIPLCQGGEDSYTNLQLLCKSCHVFKSAKENGSYGFLVDFRRSTDELDTELFNVPDGTVFEGDTEDVAIVAQTMSVLNL